MPSIIVGGNAVDVHVKGTNKRPVLAGTARLVRPGTVKFRQHTFKVERAIAVWDGNYYALAAMLALGLEEGGGAMRIGLLHYTTDEEVERALAVLAAVAGR